MTSSSWRPKIFYWIEFFYSVFATGLPSICIFKSPIVSQKPPCLSLCHVCTPLACANHGNAFFLRLVAAESLRTQCRYAGRLVSWDNSIKRHSGMLVGNSKLSVLFPPEREGSVFSRLLSKKATPHGCCSVWPPGGSRGLCSEKLTKSGLWCDWFFFFFK